MAALAMKTASRRGLRDNLIRVAVGLEDIIDIKNDLKIGLELI